MAPLPTAEDEAVAAEDEAVAAEDEDVAAEDEAVAAEDEDVAAEDEDVAAEDEDVAAEEQPAAPNSAATVTPKVAIGFIIDLTRTSAAGRADRVTSTSTSSRFNQSFDPFRARPWSRLTGAQPRAAGQIAVRIWARGNLGPPLRINVSAPGAA